MGAGRVPSAFAQRFVDQSSRIEELPLDCAALATPWPAQDSGHMLAYQACVESAQGDMPLTEAEIKQWQALTVREQALYDPSLELASEHIGQYRNIRIFIANREGASHHELSWRMHELVDAVNNFPPVDSAEAIAFAASMHLRYEVLHPFADGNGRSGRLFAHWILVRHGVRPVLFTADDRFDTYYTCFDPRDARAMINYFNTHQVSASAFDALL